MIKMAVLEPERCHLCSKIFCCIECRRNHVRNKHSIDYECPVCRNEPLILNSICQQSALFRHLVFNHLPLLCRSCGEVFNNHDDLSSIKSCSQHLMINNTPKNIIKDRSLPSSNNNSKVSRSPLFVSLQKRRLINFVSHKTVSPPETSRNTSTPTRSGKGADGSFTSPSFLKASLSESSTSKETSSSKINVSDLNTSSFHSCVSYQFYSLNYSIKSILKTSSAYSSSSNLDDFISFKCSNLSKKRVRFSNELNITEYEDDSENSSINDEVDKELLVSDKKNGIWLVSEENQEKKTVIISGENEHHENGTAPNGIFPSLVNIVKNKFRALSGMIVQYTPTFFEETEKEYTVPSIKITSEPEVDLNLNINRNLLKRSRECEVDADLEEAKYHKIPRMSYKHIKCREPIARMNK